MSDISEQRNKELDARDNRRWLIGLCISVAFGLFGVVMALLSYSHHSSPAAAPGPAARVPAPANRAPGERAHDGSRHRK